LTFPATSLLLEQAQNVHGFTRMVSQTFPGEDTRQLWAHPDAAALLDGTDDAYFPVEAFAFVTERYVLGQLVRMSMLGDPHSLHPDFEMLEAANGVWVMCCRRPKATQYRFFGRFTAKDEFVILFGRRRNQLAGDGYQAAIDEFQNMWPVYFPEGYHLANDVSGYIGGVFSDVDEAI